MQMVNFVFVEPLVLHQGDKCSLSIKLSASKHLDYEAFYDKQTGS